MQSPMPEPVAPVRRKKPYRASVWLQPVGLAWGISRAAETQTRGRPMVYIPIGAQAAVGSHLDLIAEFTLNFGHDSCDVGNCRTFQGFWVTFGGLYHPFAGQWTRGFFVQPKLMFSSFDEQAFSHSPTANPTDFGGTSRQLHLGADIGYQLVLGYIYAAVAVGVSGGYCSNCGTDRFAPMWGHPTGRADRFNVAYNVNLLRLGTVFY